LIAAGHGDAAWRYTPRQAFALAEIATDREVAQAKLSLTLARVAHHGDQKAVKSTLKELGR